MLWSMRIVTKFRQDLVHVRNKEIMEQRICLHDFGGIFLYKITTRIEIICFLDGATIFAK